MAVIGGQWVSRIPNHYHILYYYQQLRSYNQYWTYIWLQPWLWYYIKLNWNFQRCRENDWTPQNFHGAVMAAWNYIFQNKNAHETLHIRRWLNPFKLVQNSSLHESWLIKRLSLALKGLHVEQKFSSGKDERYISGLSFSNIIVQLRHTPAFSS